jgi:phage N-6-adenine-methyltransferase
VNAIELRFQEELAKTPDPVEFAVTFPNRIEQAIQLAKTPMETNVLRAVMAMGDEYLRRALPKVIRDRHERYSLMSPTESLYLDVSRKAGALWAVMENKAMRGGNGNNQYQSNSENFPNSISVEAAGFKHTHDATACVRISALDDQDYELFKQECIQNERHITISGAERIWHLLNGTHVSFNSGEDEWYTPPEYIAAATEVMGRIDLDPASSERANRIVKASKYYDEKSDGLAQFWAGKVWMNPPYAAELIGLFISKFAKHVLNGDISEGIVLVNNATETRWFNDLISVAAAVVFPNGRIRFIDKKGKASGTPLQGQAVVYVGENVEKFISVFGAFGWSANVNGR